jgi:ubiquilin
VIVIVEMKVTIKTITRKEKWVLECEEGDTVLNIKQKLSSDSGIPSEDIKLIYAGQILNDSKTINQYGIKDGHSVHLVQSKANKISPSKPESSKSDSVNSEPTENNNSTGDLNSVDLNSFLDSFISSPDGFSSMMGMMNPQMQRFLEQNPEISQSLRNPEFIRRSLEIMRNPALMQEMLRTQDRAMQNIESHPEGYNALRRLYTDVISPLENINSDATSENNSFSTNEGNSSIPTHPLPNPWAGNSNTSSVDPNSNINPAGNFGSLLESSAFQEAMRQVSSNPELVTRILNSNPYFQSNPELSRLLTNPDSMRRVFNPEVFRAMAQYQQSLQTLTRSGLIPSDLSSQDLLPPEGCNTPPEDRYSLQLEKLREMGFSDDESNIAALRATNGNLNLAIDRLLNGFM